MKAKYLLVLLSVFSAAALALEQKMENYIPKWYVQVTLSGADPNTPLDQKTVLETFIQACAKAGVDTCDLAVYDQGKQKGDGLRATGEIVREKKGLRLSKFKEMTSANQSLAAESWLGFTIDKNRLASIHKAYVRDPQSAASKFGNKVLFITLNKIGGISTASKGTPYLALTFNRKKPSGVIFTLPPDDPLLQYATKGRSVSFKCQTGGFSNNFLSLSCSLAMAGTMLKAGSEIIDLSKQQQSNTTANSPGSS